MTRDHELKCWPESFAPLRAGLKLAELRWNDRGYEAGNTVTLREFVPSDGGRPRAHPTGRYTGEFERRRIRHVADVDHWATGYVLLSLEPL